MFHRFHDRAGQDPDMYAVAVSNWFDVLGALDSPVELWDTFKRETLHAAKECIGSRGQGVVLSRRTRWRMSRRVALPNQDQHRALTQD
ncbi:hypothetical protein GWK47_004418 [Chionoecetes opilio]|uniref:Uncharacterized protein n=1 Tax=Chionoecetes opilio TaxID=41210 RepID=A0A8J4YF69_CHIOP|nr:hypothetical protein GWK47_004418 [Chionoecetes opilio]